MCARSSSARLGQRRGQLTRTVTGARLQCRPQRARPHRSSTLARRSFSGAGTARLERLHERRFRVGDPEPLRPVASEPHAGEDQLLVEAVAALPR